MNSKDITEVVTAVAAFVGMGLGLYNLVIERSKRKVKVQIIPKAVIRRVNDPFTQLEGIVTSSNEFDPVHIDEYFAIEAINLSTFPIVIDSIGFRVSGKTERMEIVRPVVLDGGKWPRKLEPRESVTFYASLAQILCDPGSASIKCAFAETSCGVLCKGTSGALRGLVVLARQNQLRCSQVYPS